MQVTTKRVLKKDDFLAVIARIVAEESAGCANCGHYLCFHKGACTWARADAVCLCGGFVG